MKVEGKAVGKVAGRVLPKQNSDPEVPAWARHMAGAQCQPWKGGGELREDKPGQGNS